MIIRFPSENGFIGRGRDGFTYRAEYPRYARQPVWIDGRGRIVERPPPEVLEQLSQWLYATVAVRRRAKRPPLRVAWPGRDDGPGSPR